MLVAGRGPLRLLRQSLSMRMPLQMLSEASKDPAKLVNSPSRLLVWASTTCYLSRLGPNHGQLSKRCSTVAGALMSSLICLQCMREGRRRFAVPL